MAVENGDWAEYKVVDVFNMTIYGRELKPGDKLRYGLAGRELSNMTTWWGELIAYVEKPLCDVWLNGEKIATKVDPAPFNMTELGPFCPASEAFWHDCKRWYNSSWSAAFITQEYKFDIDEDAIYITLNGKMTIIFFIITAAEVRTSHVIDKDTGITRNFYFFLALSGYGFNTTFQQYSYVRLKLIDTSVEDAWPSPSQAPTQPPTPGTKPGFTIPSEIIPWLSIGSLALAIAAIIAAIWVAIKVKRGLDQLIAEVEAVIARSV